MIECDCDLPMTRQDKIWEEPEHKLEWNQLHGENKGFRVFTREYKTAFGMRLRNGKLVTVGRLLLEGWSNVNISRKINVGRPVVAKLRDIIETKKGKIYCKCGKESNHSGKCLYRKNDTTNGLEITLGRIRIKPPVHILDCGCVVDNKYNIRLIKCDSEYCDTEIYEKTR